MRAYFVAAVSLFGLSAAFGCDNKDEKKNNFYSCGTQISTIAAVREAFALTCDLDSEESIPYADSFDGDQNHQCGTEDSPLMLSVRSPDVTDIRQDELTFDANANASATRRVVDVAILKPEVACEVGKKTVYGIRVTSADKRFYLELDGLYLTEASVGKLFPLDQITGTEMGAVKLEEYVRVQGSCADPFLSQAIGSSFIKVVSLPSKADARLEVEIYVFKPSESDAKKPEELLHLRVSALVETESYQANKTACESILPGMACKGQVAFHTARELVDPADAVSQAEFDEFSKTRDLRAQGCLAAE